MLTTCGYFFFPIHVYKFTNLKKRKEQETKPSRLIRMINLIIMVNSCIHFIYIITYITQYRWNTHEWFELHSDHKHEKFSKDSISFFHGGKKQLFTKHVFECGLCHMISCFSVSLGLALLCVVMRLSFVCLWSWSSSAGATCHKEARGFFLQRVGHPVWCWHVWCFLCLMLHFFYECYNDFCIFYAALYICITEFCPCLWLCSCLHLC